MRWDALEITRFARGAGFARDDVVTATALALATSGGIDHYEFAPGSPGVGRYVGLWGIDTDAWPVFADTDLFVPQHAATAAHALFELVGGWEWSPTFMAGAHRAHLAAAGVSITDELRVQVAKNPLTFHRTGQRIDHALERLARTRAQLAQMSMTKGHRWQPTMTLPTSGR